MDYKSDISKYTSKVNDKAIDSIVRYCGIALQTRDASLVSCTDSAEIDRIRRGFAAKVLGLGESDADAAISTVCEKMKSDNTKHRVTFYYLLAEVAGKMDTLT
jgi:Asp/Glu/hydantoin racemase